MSIEKAAFTVERKKLTQQLYDELERQILAGTLLPGTKLSEENVAEAFGVSRSPAREAIMELERIGLASRSGPRDRIVATPTVQTVRDFFQVWWILDVGRTYLACLEATEHDHEKLREVLDKMEEAQDGDDQPAYTESSKVFHSLLYGQTRNQLLEQIVTDYGKHLAWFKQLYFEHLDQSDNSRIEHRQIVEAFIAKDLTALTEVIRKHILRQGDAIIKNLQAQQKIGPDAAE